MTICGYMCAYTVAPMHLQTFWGFKKPVKAFWSHLDGTCCSAKFRGKMEYQLSTWLSHLGRSSKAIWGLQRVYIAMYNLLLTYAVITGLVGDYTHQQPSKMSKGWLMMMGDHNDRFHPFSSKVVAKRGTKGAQSTGLNFLRRLVPLCGGPKKKSACGGPLKILKYN